MQQAAALWEIVTGLKAAGWDELSMLFLNQAMVVSDFQYLSTAYPGPVVQDTDDGDLWEAFGVGYNSVAIVDRDGDLAEIIIGPKFPDDAAAITAAIEEVLSQP